VGDLPELRCQAPELDVPVPIRPRLHLLNCCGTASFPYLRICFCPGPFTDRAVLDSTSRMAAAYFPCSTSRVVPLLQKSFRPARSQLQCTTASLPTPLRMMAREAIFRRVVAERMDKGRSRHGGALPRELLYLLDRWRHGRGPVAILSIRCCSWFSLLSLVGGE
jgi:hypothetical protein